MHLGITKNNETLIRFVKNGELEKENYLRDDMRSGGWIFVDRNIETDGVTLIFERAERLGYWYLSYGEDKKSFGPFASKEMLLKSFTMKSSEKIYEVWYTESCGKDRFERIVASSSEECSEDNGEIEIEVPVYKNESDRSLRNGFWGQLGYSYEEELRALERELSIARDQQRMFDEAYRNPSNPNAQPFDRNASFQGYTVNPSQQLTYTYRGSQNLNFDNQYGHLVLADNNVGRVDAVGQSLVLQNDSNMQNHLMSYNAGNDYPDNREKK